MTDRSLDEIILGPPPSTGDDWYFSPRQAEGLDDADFEIISIPLEPSQGPSDGIERDSRTAS